MKCLSNTDHLQVSAGGKPPLNHSANISQPSNSAVPAAGRGGERFTHRPLEHDLGVADGLGVGDVRAGDGPAGEAPGESGHLVGPRGRAPRALPVVVHRDHSEPIHFSF